MLRRKYKKKTLRSDKRVWFLGVPLNFDNTFRSYRFGEKTIDLHRQHLASSTVPHTVPSVTRADYLDVHRLYNDYEDMPPHLPPASLHLGFWRFNQLYPNIQVLVLKNLTNSNSPVDKRPFVKFLQTCRSLVKLKIIYPDFRSECFDEIFQLPSLAKLSSLFLFEKKTYKERIRFDRFLSSFTDLRFLKTNVVTCDAMISLVVQMAREATFHFAFWFKADDKIQDSNWLRFIFTTIGLPKNQCHLTLLQSDFRDESFQRQLFAGPFTFINLQEAFKEPAVRRLAHHWLDKY